MSPTSPSTSGSSPSPASNDLIVISDLAYAEIYFGDTPTPSILQVEGAKDVAVEFTSMSKTYSMAGWRIGFAVGNARLIAALARVKSYLDYGAFTPVQAAAFAALNGPQDIVEANRKLYKKRRDVLVESFGRAGWDIPVPQASMFAWAPIPEQFRELGSMEFAKRLLTEAHVAVAPGVGFGEEGEGFVRLALVENEQRLRQAAKGVKKCSPASPGLNLRGGGGFPCYIPREDMEARMTGILDKFYVEHGIHGARVMAHSHQLTSNCLADGEIDTAIQMLKDDLDACAKEMKRLVAVNLRGALFEGWPADA